MSSGRTSEDGKTILFEINNGGTAQGTFTLTHVDGDDTNPDRILMRMRTSSHNYPAMTETTTAIMIPKERTMVLSHFFKQAAELMEKWYEEELKEGVRTWK